MAHAHSSKQPGTPRFTDQAIRIVAENKIREAMKAGAFDRLPGTGKPIADLDEPFDPMWWVKRWLQRERFINPPSEESEPAPPQSAH
ncbi:MAG TPA: DUF1992 domain-containing protein [Phycisphaeraceae bacterium]